MWKFTYEYEELGEWVWVLDAETCAALVRDAKEAESRFDAWREEEERGR